MGEGDEAPPYRRRGSGVGPSPLGEVWGGAVKKFSIFVSEISK